MFVKQLMHVNSSLQWQSTTTSQSLEQRLVLTHKLGQGAFGEVFHATERASDAPSTSTSTSASSASSASAKTAIKKNGLEFAVKLIPAANAAAQDDIKHEIEMLQKCSRNPFVVGYFGVFGPDSQQRLWILMDYCVRLNVN
jgi:serine/threonine protein kinase